MKTKSDTTTAYVNAWGSESCGGFDWYRTPEAANKAFEDEKENCREFADSKWTAYRFDVAVPSTDPDTITDYIDERLPDLCDSATQTFSL